MFKFVSFLIVILGVYLVKDVNTKPNSAIRSFVKPNTPENLERLKNLKGTDLAEEFSGQFQGDIIINEEQLQEAADNAEKGSKTGLRDSKYRWKNNIIPYRIDESYFNREQIAYIHSAVQRIMDISCLRYVAKDDTHEDFITVVGKKDGCYSSVGRQGGEQFINLAPYELEAGCFRLYSIVHEFTHALGFYHMQSDSERDGYVRIEYDRVILGKENNFEIIGSSIINNLGIEYDYGSMMHYSKNAFSVDGSDTIIPLRPLNGLMMGQRIAMTEKDIRRLNMLYECVNEVVTTTTQKITTQAPVVTTTTKPGNQDKHNILNFLTELIKNIFGNKTL